MKNDHCEGSLLPQRIVYQGFLVDGAYCSDCGEVQYHPEQMQLVLAFQALKGRRLGATVTTTGDSTAIRIPKSLARQFGLERGREIGIAVTSPTTLELILPQRIEHVVQARNPVSLRESIGETKEDYAPVSVLPQALIQSNSGQEETYAA